MTERALCLDCERSTGGACPRHPVRFNWGRINPEVFARDFLQAINEAQRVEREACARICDCMAEPVDESLKRGLKSEIELKAMYDMARHIAKLIRARGSVG